MYVNYTDFKAVRLLEGAKVSHDLQGKDLNLFSYRELMGIKGLPGIGIPCKANNLVVIDIDVESEQHSHDGREFWANFCSENNIPQTYSVKTASGGFHFYFALPQGINPDGFRPPSSLAPGVDVKYNGWVAAPPTPGYDIVWGDISKIHVAPITLMAAFTTSNTQPKTFEDVTAGISLNAHRPFTEKQIETLREEIQWVQTHVGLSRSEWRDGLFALKAGINDPFLLDELATEWTKNLNYQEGDEFEALSMVERADKYGPIGPGSILSIIKSIKIREGATTLDSQFNFEEILNRARVKYTFAKDGSLKVANTETNCADIIGAMYDENELYHDVRLDLYIFRGECYDENQLTNILTPRIQSPGEGMGLEKFRKSIVRSSIEIVLEKRKRDPHLDYVKSLEWDGVPRIETFFQRFTGVEDNEYHRAVSKNLWVALAARTLKPGIKFDSVVIIEGKEGVRKSSLIEAIGGQYTFAPSRSDAMENHDEIRKMHQSVVVELPELMGLINQKSERIKAFLASPFDTVRKLYSKQALRKDRSFIFIGTTNSSEYLHIDMGRRRFWPITIPDHMVEIDIDAIKEERDQLFAEGKKYFYDSYPFYTIDPSILSKHTGSKVVTDPIDYLIDEMTKDETTASVVNIFQRLRAGGYITSGLGASAKSRITSSLRRLKFVRNSEQADLYVRKPEQYSPLQSYDFSSII